MRQVYMRLVGWLAVLSLLVLQGATTAGAAPVQQDDDPAALCAEGTELFLKGRDEEALPLLEAGFGGREAGSSWQVTDAMVPWRAKSMHRSGTPPQR